MKDIEILRKCTRMVVGTTPEEFWKAKEEFWRLIKKYENSSENKNEAFQFS